MSLVNFAVFSAYSKVIETAIHKLMKILFLTSFLTLAAFGQQLADKQPVGKNLWRASMVLNLCAPAACGMRAEA